MLGIGGVGKSAFRNKLLNPEEPLDPAYRVTVGYESVDIERTIDDEEVVFTLVDTSGQGSGTRVRKALFDGADGAILMFSYTNPSSRSRIVSDFVGEFKGLPPVFPIVLVGNKTDVRGYEQMVKHESVLLTVKTLGKLANVKIMGPVEMSLKNDDKEQVEEPLRLLANFLVEARRIVAGAVRETSHEV